MESPSAIQKFLRSELSFYITLIGAVFAIAGFYFGISNKIELITERLETHMASTAYMSSQMALNTTKIAVLESKIK